MNTPTLDEDALQQIYTWIDEIPLSRPKRNITRDFSDGVLIAEIIHHFLPKLVDLHNYNAANSSQQKTENWNLLSRKVFSKVDYNISDNHIKGAVGCKPGIIELVLNDLKIHIESYIEKKRGSSQGNDEQHEGSENGYGESYNTAFYGYQNGFAGAGPGYYDPYAMYNQQPSQQMLPNQQMIMGQAGQPPPQMQPIQRPPLPAVMSQQQLPYQYQSQPHAAPDMRNGPSTYQGGSNKTSPKHKLGSKTKSKSHMNGATKVANTGGDSSTVLPTRMELEEKEQQLLSAQETIQILQAKIRRLEHLLHLKDLRIDDLNSKLGLNPSPKHLPHQTLPHPPHPPNQPPLHFQPRPPLPGIPRPPTDGVYR